MTLAAGTPIKWRNYCLIALILLTGSYAVRANPSLWTRLPIATSQAFADYIGRTERQNAAGPEAGKFLWPDEAEEKERSELYEKLKSGSVEMRRMDVSVKGGNITGGLIHDWEGLVFIPGARLDDVLRVLEDYDQHAKYYAPDVEQSKIEEHDGDHFKVFLRFRRHKFVTVVLNTEHEVTYYRDSPLRAHSRSSAIRIAEVEGAGTASEKEKTPGDDNGFLWKMETWWRMEERDGGVYVQNEVVSLTRDIPTGLGWLVEPFITSIPKETLQFTLEATRKAVLTSKNN